MNSPGDPAEATSLASWRIPVGDDPRAAELDARAAAARADTAATLGRAETTDAARRPVAADRDPALVEVIAAAGRFYQSQLAGSWVPGYLASRRLDAALLPTSPWKVGYAPASWTALRDHLRGLGFTDADMLTAGLVVNGRNGQLRDHFRDRLIIPLRAEDGIATGFIGRRHPRAGHDHGPKYLNTPDTPIFTKGHILAGLAEGRGAFQRGAQPILTEGPLDAIAVSIAGEGAFASVAPCGTALTGDHVAALARTIPLADRGLLVALDGDTAGRAAAVRAYWRLTPVTSSLTAITLPDSADPAGLLETGDRAALREALTSGVHPLADLVTDSRLDDWARGRELVFAELQIGALRAAATAMANMPGDHVGPQAARLCALFSETYGWTPQEVTTEIIDTIERQLTSALARPMRGDSWHSADSPWAVVTRATAPPRQRTPIDTATTNQQPALRLLQPQSAQRGTLSGQA
ncbi:MAG TPA: toprim domain-containing protein [Streptosporangiaceae bacterium]|nr:toprim domain-containing protein [Streptosporangiaceae bacterium]